MYLQEMHKEFTVKPYTRFMTYRQTVTIINLATTIQKLITQNNRQPHEP